jgi:hypothetical protein
LSRRLPWRLHMHDPSTSMFVVFEVSGGLEPAYPPPPIRLVWRALLRMHDALTSGTAFGRLRLSGLFLVTYSALAYAALCRVARRERPVRWGFASGPPSRASLHRAAQGMPYAVALLNV